MLLYEKNIVSLQSESVAKDKLHSINNTSQFWMLTGSAFRIGKID